MLNADTGFDAKNKTLGVFREFAALIAGTLLEHYDGHIDGLGRACRVTGCDQGNESSVLRPRI